MDVGDQPHLPHGAAGGVEQVDVILDQLRELQTFLLREAAGHQFVGAEAVLDRQLGAAELPDAGEDAKREAGPVLQTPPVLVGAPVGARRGELGQQPAVTAVEQDHIEAGLLDPKGRLGVVLDDLLDQVVVHHLHVDLAAEQSLVELAGHHRRGDGRPGRR